MVAGVGLEPHDLRVMSPTSYQLLYPAIFTFLKCSNIILQNRWIVNSFFNIKSKLAKASENVQAETTSYFSSLKNISVSILLIRFCTSL